MTFFNTIILLGTIQGIISFALLLKAKNSGLSNRVLATLILLISLACLNIFLLELDIRVENDFLRFLLIIAPLTVIMPFGPLVYFYIFSLSNSPYQLTRKDYRHFYPIVLDLLPYIIYFVSYLLLFSGVITDSDILSIGPFVDGYDKYVDVPRWFSISIYLLMTHRLISKNKSDERMSWGTQMVKGVLTFQVIWFIFLVLYLVPTTSGWLLSTVGWYPLYIPLTMMVYWFGIKGFLMNVQAKTNVRKPMTLDENEVQRSINVLNDVMKKEKLYLNALLGLNDVVNHTNLPQKTISAVLNQHLGKSFNEFVNDFRIEEVKRKMIDEKNSNLTLSGIAFDCGFNSQATFQRVFKASTKQTPGQYAKLMKNKFLNNDQI